MTSRGVVHDQAVTSHAVYRGPQAALMLTKAGYGNIKYNDLDHKLTGAFAHRGEAWEIEPAAQDKARRFKREVGDKYSKNVNNVHFARRIGGRWRPGRRGGGGGGAAGGDQVWVVGRSLHV